MKASTILETIGNTPHIRVNRLFGNAEVWIKSERANPGGSIKDRIALAMVEDAEKSGALKPGGTIIEPTSGNTGIGLAMVAAVKGYKLILVMPESMSLERRRLMSAYGATFDLTPKEGGMNAAIAGISTSATSLPDASARICGSGATKRSARRRLGKSHAQMPVTPTASAPPPTTAITGPNREPARPARNSPSSLEAEMNRPDTAETRPRMASGVWSWMSEERT